MIMQKDLNQISSIIEAVKKQLTNGDILLKNGLPN